MSAKKKETKQTKEKTLTKTKRNKDKLPLSGISVNLGNLDVKRQKFILAYTSMGAETENNVEKSMLAAGYTKSMARSRGWEIRYEPAVDSVIQEIRNKIVVPRLNQALTKTLEILEKTLTMDPNDFYKQVKRVDENGETYTIQVPKLLDELTEDQRSIINGLDYKGTRGIPDYDKLNKQDAIKILLSLKKDFDMQLEKENAKKESTETSTEIVIEQIKDKVAAKVKVIQKNDEVAKLAGKYYDEPDNLLEEP